ncbi:aldehyde:ferredoxin oxidoreductase [Geoalkalibacter ferrihydriticus]|uniref:Aldehyde:ferredoxin oxidoreductase n=2 Tax=Geoalkalibacter ferrihydriticus TaxID=392333 RepID=A0A0C2HTM3_9BACT|nr:aldehyde ferredoxin oxidoreductase C-terminal domain-containing protein [Geoalkalibacter ferrihydriticus]KIH78130.1 aldehyde:ferredoxin oxidoreductase [Geoalkalibacter ferrihydriticus DSM 17813]SDM80225.1 aldehyde:ferredoxin oxidoreductase [Geoalkalibacter ferrihydriticus]
MKILTTDPVREPQKIFYKRAVVDLKSGSVTYNDVPCRNLEDVLGGFGRSFQDLAARRIMHAYCDENPLIVNTGLLTGSRAMTGMRIYFSGYSPIKAPKKGAPAAMWSAASGKFGAKFKWTGLDELVFENRSETPVYVLIREGKSGPVVELKPAGHLRGLLTHDKIMRLQKDYADAHFAAIGPAGENWEEVFMGAVACSTENQLRTGEDKSRFAGRGGLGSLMGYKNVLALVAQSADKLKPLTPEMKQVNLNVVKGGGSLRLQPVSRGGGGGTWGAYDVMQPFHAVPVNNFRPQGNDLPEKLFRENVDKDYFIKTEACFRCGITCHNNIHERLPDGSAGKFLAKFDYEPLNLLGTNLGLHDAGQAAALIHLCDNYGMDAISLGVTVSYVLSYNARHPDQPLLNGAVFGDFGKIKELVERAGRGQYPEIGQGSQRLAQSTGEEAYAYQVKGLEIAAYQPETNPGYAWAIAGGHMSMGTYGMLIREGKADLDSWVQAITADKLQIVGFDMIGLCKFFDMPKGICSEMVQVCLKSEHGLEVSTVDLRAAVRRAFLRGLALELRQGYTKQEYCLPAEVFDDPNPHLKVPRIATREFFDALSQRVWAVFEEELEAFMDEVGSR